MTDRIYSVGKVSVARGDTAVTVSGGPLLLSNVKELDWLSVLGVGGCKVMGIPDDSHLEIDPWPFDDVVNGDYNVVLDGLNSFTAPSIAVAVVQLVEDLEDDDYFVAVKSTETAPNPRSGNEGQNALQRSTGKMWQKIAGVWTYIGIYGPLIFDPEPYSPATNYAMRTLVAFGGKLYSSKQDNNLGHAPASSPTWWDVVIAGGDTVYISMDDSDRPASGETVLKWPCPEATTFYAGLASSFAHASTGATLAAVYSIKKNGTQFATLTFAAAGQGGAQLGSFVCASNTTLSPGDILTIVAPNPRDATLSTIGITLTGYR